MTQRSIFVRLSVKDAEQAIAALRKVGGEGSTALKRIERASGPTSQGLLAVDRASRVTQGGIRNLATSFAIFEGPLGAVSGRINALGAGLGRVNPLFLTLAAGTAAAAGGFTKSATAGAQYERFLLRTEQQLIATGRASGLTSQELDRFTFSLAQNTLASTEGARRAAASLLTFRAVSGDTFKEALTLSQDLAASGIGNLESNVLQLGKAPQDPVRGITALSRAGVQFTDQQKEQIRTLKEAGDVTAAQSLILAELRRQVGGAGEAEAGGLSGAYDTLTENIGRFFEKVAERTGTVDTLTDSMKGLADVVDELTPDTSIEGALAQVNAQVAQQQGVLAAFEPAGSDNEALRAAQTEARNEASAALD
ncbi:MAG TPA: hypothetical protein EYP07_11360, partial [Kiloniellaceae bacterium]|nr:hypothetical protein [Kiloniellaceae bacterium]